MGRGAARLARRSPKPRPREYPGSPVQQQPRTALKTSAHKRSADSPTRLPEPDCQRRPSASRGVAEGHAAGPRGEVDQCARPSSACLTGHIAVRSPPHIPLPCAARQSEGGPTAAARGCRKGDPRPWTHTTRLGQPAPTSPTRRHRRRARSAPKGRPWEISSTRTSRTTGSGSSGPSAPPVAGPPISPPASAAPRGPPR